MTIKIIEPHSIILTPRSEVQDMPRRIELAGRLTTSGDCDDSVCTNEEFWKVVDEAFLAGVTESEVSDVFGSSLTTVSRWKSHKGAPCSETQVRKFAVDKLKEMISNKNKQE